MWSQYILVFMKSLLNVIYQIFTFETPNAEWLYILNWLFIKNLTEGEVPSWKQMAAQCPTGREEPHLRDTLATA